MIRISCSSLYSPMRVKCIHRCRRACSCSVAPASSLLPGSLVVVDMGPLLKVVRLRHVAVPVCTTLPSDCDALYRQVADLTRSELYELERGRGWRHAPQKDKHALARDQSSGGCG